MVTPIERSGVTTLCLLPIAADPYSGRVLPQVTFLGHATVLVEMGGLRILTDPVLSARVMFLGRVATEIDPQLYSNIDVVVISHMHHDHCDVRSLRQMPYARMIVPNGAGSWFAKKGFNNVVELQAGQSEFVGDVVFNAVPAVHDGTRTPFGPHADALGYVMSTDDSSVYFAGDTDVFSGMRAIGESVGRQLDIALLPVWGWGPNLGPGHMNPRSAADAVRLLDAKYAMPIHWGTLFPVGLRKVRPKFGSLLTDPPQTFAAIATQLELPTKVRVIQPGQPMVYDQ